MRSAILILLPFLSLCLCNPSPLPNIDKLGSGYDILFGNPHSIGTTDPGFRQNVYNTGIYTGELTPDKRFLKPNGTSVSICQACALSFGTSFVSGGASYAKTLSVNVKTNFSLWVAAFKGSYDYQSVEKDTSTYARKLTKSTATCEVYCAVIETFTPPPPPESFFGGMFQVDDCNRNNIVNTMTGALNCPSGYIPLPGARIKAPEGSMCGAVQSYCVNRNTPTPHTFGGIYEKNDFNSNSNFPNILNNNQFGCPPGFNTFRMERAIDPEILCGTNVFICLAGFTEGKNQIGGFYQVNDVGSDDNINNPFTSGPSCPPGYNPILYGRIKAPEGRKNGVNSFLCILSR